MKQEYIKNFLGKYDVEIKSQTSLDKIYNLYISEPITQVECYYYGMFHKQNNNNKKMIKYFDAAGHHEESLNELCDYYNREEEYSRIGYYVELLIQFNSIRSKNNVLKYYVRPFSRDRYELKKYSEIGIKQNNPYAMYCMGRYYFYDTVKMVKYYKMAIDNNCIKAMLGLGKHYYSVENFIEAIKYYEMAMNLNDTLIPNELIKCYIKTNNYEKACKYSVKDETDLFIALYEKRAMKYLIKYMNIFYSSDKLIISKCIDIALNNNGQYESHIEITKNYNEYMKYDPDENERLNKKEVCKLLYNLNDSFMKYNLF